MLKLYINISIGAFVSYFAIYMIGLFFNIVFSFRKYFYLIELDPSSEDKRYLRIKELRKANDEAFEDKIKIFILPFSYILEYITFRSKALSWLKVNEDKQIIDYYVAYLEFTNKKDKSA